MGNEFEINNVPTQPEHAAYHIAEPIAEAEEDYDDDDDILSPDEVVALVEGIDTKTGKPKAALSLACTTVNEVTGLTEEKQSLSFLGPTFTIDNMMGHACLKIAYDNETSLRQTMALWEIHSDMCEQVAEDAVDFPVFVIVLAPMQHAGEYAIHISNPFVMIPTTEDLAKAPTELVFIADMENIEFLYLGDDIMTQEEIDAEDALIAAKTATSLARGVGING